MSAGKLLHTKNVGTHTL